MHWFKNFYRYFLKHLLHLFSFLFGASLIAIFIFFAKLYVSPLDLPSLKPRLESYLATKLQNTSIEFSTCALTWDREKSGLVLDLGKAHISHQNLPLLAMQKLLLKFRLLQLILQKGDVYELILIEPSLQYEIKPQTSSSKVAFPSFMPGIIIRKGNLSIQDGTTHWKASNVNLRLKRQGEKIFFHSEIPLDQTKLTISAEAQLRSKNIHAVYAKATLTDCSFQGLDQLWPEWLAPAPRTWVLEHIQLGHVDRAEIETQLLKTDEGFKISKVGGFINIPTAEVRYIMDLPTVSQVSGRAHFDHQNFMIQVKGGHCEGIQIQGGTVAIRNFTQDIPDMDINLSLQSPIGKALTFLNHPYIHLLDQFHLPLDKVEGQSLTDLHLHFPLHTKIKLSDLEVQAQAELTDVKIPNAFSFDHRPINIQAPQLLLSLRNGSLETKGKVLLLNETMDTIWRHHFQKGDSFYEIKGKVRSDNLTPLLTQTPVTFQGEATIDLKATQKGQFLETLQLAADLKDAECNLSPFGIITRKTHACHLFAHLHFNQGKIHHIEQLALTGHNLNFILHHDKAQDQYTCHNAILQNSTLSLDLKFTPDGMTQLNLKSPRLVLYPDQKKQTIQERHVELNFDIDQLLIVSQGTLRHVKGQYIQRGLQIQQIRLDAEQESTKDKLHIQTDQEGYFIIQCENAGLLSRLLKTRNNLDKGQLVADVTSHPDGHLEGHFLISGAYMSDASLLTKLIGHASPFGIIDAIQGKGISLEKISGHFYRQNDKIVIKDGTASGHTVGLTFNGFISDKSMKIYGTIMPFNFINKTISHIPFMGYFMRDGIFGVAYQMKGDPSDPKIMMNPLSAFAPGAFRKIFDKTKWAEFPQEKEKEKRSWN